jgi:osmotically-inducible protein OsmY
MANNMWGDDRDGNDHIMRRGDDRTIDYGRGGDTRGGSEYRNAQWGAATDSPRDTYRAADRDTYRQDRDMGHGSNFNQSYGSNDTSSRGYRNTGGRNENRHSMGSPTSRQGATGQNFSQSWGQDYGSTGSSWSAASDDSHNQRDQYGQRGDYSQSYRGFGQGSGNDQYGSQYGNQSYGSHSGNRSYGSNSQGQFSSDYGSNRQGFSNYGSSETWGQHSGKGPKGYRRSDDRIKEEVSDALERHPQIDASEIEVDVKEGVVTLKGHVEERRIKRMAEDSIENLPGVRDVRNELMVDQSLFQRAKEALFGSSNESEASSTQSSKSASQRSKH